MNWSYFNVFPSNYFFIQKITKHKDNLRISEDHAFIEWHYCYEVSIGDYSFNDKFLPYDFLVHQDKLRHEVQVNLFHKLVFTFYETN